VQDTAAMLGMEGLLKRKPKELSGGQRQRVALGRAIVREPKVFLMDEPLSNLDAKLRVQTRAELIKLHRRLGITTVYVTHDQTEAMTMGDRIAVLRDGKMQQVDAPLALYNRPANMFVAGFIGSPAMNFLRATVEAEDGACFVRTNSLQLPLPETHAQLMRGRVGQPIILGLRPDDIYDHGLAPELPYGYQTQLPVDVTEPMGSTVYVYLAAGEDALIADLDSETRAKDGQPLGVVLDLAKLHLFDPETEAALI
jgi:multiple sugar transport system ATP-binding protein